MCILKLNISLESPAASQRENRQNGDNAILSEVMKKKSF